LGQYLPRCQLTGPEAWAAQFSGHAVSVLAITAGEPAVRPQADQVAGEAMRYVLFIRGDESAAISPQERSRWAAGLTAFQDEMQACGALLGGEQLQPTTAAATVQCWDGGDIVVGRGPLAGNREQIAGFLVVDGKDLDDAIGLAARIPAAWYGTIEVRPVRETEGS
jgi:hypothetical protein